MIGPGEDLMDDIEEGATFRLDHLVILVGDLGRAMEDYEKLGFEVVSGGEHADGLTRNALVLFRDGTYLELVAFVDPGDTRDNFWGWRSAGISGLVDWCMVSDDVEAGIRSVVRRGVRASEPHPGGRRLPDGRELEWRAARFDQDGRSLPFLIEDVTPREWRVPGGSAVEHPNGATGISALTVAVPDLERYAALFDALMGEETLRSSRDPGTVEYELRGGSQTIALIGPTEKNRDVREHLAERGPGPFGVTVSVDGEREIASPDLRLTHGVRLEFSRETSGP